MSGTQPRMLRAALFTALVVTLSAASHVLLSQVPLPLGTLAAVAGGVFVLAYLLAGRERGFWSIAALVVPLELAADTVFTTGQHVCYGQTGGPVTGTLRSFGFDVLCGGSEVGAPLAQVAGAGPGPASELLASADPAAAWYLLAAHIAIGLGAAAWLRRGERAFAQLVRAMAAVAFRPLAIAVAAVTSRPARVRPLPRAARQPRSLSPLLIAHCVGRRGPPRPAAC